MTRVTSTGAKGVTRFAAIVPAMPCRDVAASVAFYTEKLGFEGRHRDGGYAVLVRDGVRLSLWQADDEGWRRGLDATRPVCSGAESFICGTASFVVDVEGIDELFERCREHGILHPVSKAVEQEEFGPRSFAALDPDGNLITFLEWPPEPSL
jgi:catechol 2,3-dioxygenase-like lactoylglutathione lyase family enzyme